MWHFLFPTGSRPGQPDEMFADQMRAVIAAGYTASLCSDLVFSGAKPLRDLPTDRTLVYRGWMATGEEYDRFVRAVNVEYDTLLTDSMKYVACHYLPNWYPLIADLTPETHVFPVDADLESELRLLDWGTYFIKDYVKSLQSGRGSVVHRPEDARLVVAELKEERGRIEGGICVRKYEPLLPGTESRYFVLRSQVFAPDDRAIPSVVETCSSRIMCPFYSVDVATREDGVERIIEIGDGQVSDLKEWSAERFATIWS
jgi:hypothetical protein